MSKEKTTGNPGKRKQEMNSTPKRDAQPAAGGELHQIASGEHPRSPPTRHGTFRQSELAQGKSARPALLEDFILREKITHFDHERIPERIVHARATGVHGFFELTTSLKHIPPPGYLPR